MSESNSSIPLGWCQCGCGQKTSVAKKTNSAFGYVKGVPMRYLNGHGRWKSNPHYVAQDRGHDTRCWIWTGTISKGGYGKKHVDGREWFAHRYFYEQKYGPISAELPTDHLCRVRACCNPDHVEPVTHGENVRRGLVAKLDWAKVGLIRRLYAGGSYTQTELARMFGVKPNAICKLVNYKTWATP